MFKCNKCHTNTEGEPAFKNAAGSFCVHCKKIIHELAADAMRERNKQLLDICPWCGDKLHDGNRLATRDKLAENVCAVCSKNRDWLLKCIRHSDRPSRYASRVELREKAGREQRFAEEKAKLSLATESISNRAESADEKIARLENVLKKIQFAFGIK